MSSSATNSTINNEQAFIAEVLNDYKLCCVSREASLLGRKEVLTGKAKFGIFGDGKELPQVVVSKFFNKGDIRSGYYRDQTLMFALGILSVQEFFAQLYATPNVSLEPSSAGRSMNGHFATRFLDDKGDWLNLTNRYNSSADVSPTASQMPRLLGLAWASKIYKNNKSLENNELFSNNGNEIAWGTIGNASTSEGHFWEVLNAAGVLQVPMLLSIWDDEYGISVHNEHQTTKEDIGALIKGFQREQGEKGFELFTVNGWDYADLLRTYKKAEEVCRQEHVPVVVHVKQLTQPQGHSTSGSHERYKSKERLQWEDEHDCIKKFKNWILEKGLTSEDQLCEIENQAKEQVKNEKKAAWQDYRAEIDTKLNVAADLIDTLGKECSNAEIIQIGAQLKSSLDPIQANIGQAVHKSLFISVSQEKKSRQALVDFYNQFNEQNKENYNSLLYSRSSQCAERIDTVLPKYDEEALELNGYEILQSNFDRILTEKPEVIAFGEDVGKIGDVNQGFAGLQEKHGSDRVMDTGIRELSIVGQAIGASMRGLRPIAEIQYLDYLLYGIQILSDDVVTLQYRTKGGQKAPLIIRTRGHRLEGIWHSGSPMGMIVNALRGMHVLVPRDMTRAAAFYNTMLESDEPALIVECLNGYRLKEKVPSNLAAIRIKPGLIDVLQEGKDITLVTYGSCVRIAEKAIETLSSMNISVELIDAQSLIPFDVNHRIVQSVKKTNKLVVLDEDVEGGASAYILQQVLEEQKAFQYLDSAPLTITSKNHRPAYSSDGDYFSKPNAEEVVTKIYQLMNEYYPSKYPNLGFDWN